MKRARTGQRILNMEEVCVRTSLGENTIMRLMQDGKFPRRRKLTKRRRGWLEADVDEWISKRKEEK